MFELASCYRFLVVYTLYMLCVHNSLLLIPDRYETDVGMLMNHIPWTKNAGLDVMQSHRSMYK